MFRRVILIVLDGVGVGALPDAAAYGDAGAATLPHVAKAVGGLRLPQLEQLGLGHIVPLEGVSAERPARACWGKMAERSAGKDSVSGHWELAGVISRQPFATFPTGFPEEIIARFKQVTGYSSLGNIAASGTDILRLLGEEHLATGRPIVYTSTDSVFQIAAHEEVIPVDKLYALCQQTFELLRPWNICRVIARPFRGERADNFYRTSARHDFTTLPPQPTLLDRLLEKGLESFAVGKIKDLYAGRGLTQHWPSCDNCDGMKKILLALDQLSEGVLLANLVDFDMLYGHRLDPHGFASALEQFDAWLPHLCQRLTDDDLLLISADHGCDPTTPGTDHSREYVPLLAWSPALRGGVALGVRESFADVSATIAENFSLPMASGYSFLSDLVSG